MPIFTRIKLILSEVPTILIGVLIAFVLRMFFYEPFNIPSGSMYPTLNVGDYVLVSKSEYGYSKYSIFFSPPLFDGRIFSSPPQQGEVAVFRNPTRTDIDYIKRVIGLPNDRIQMKQGRLYINGTLIKRERIEDYQYPVGNGRTQAIAQFQETLPNGKKYYILEALGDNGSLDNTEEYIVPPDHYFMMGDNRDNSVDSRVTYSVGSVPLENFIGPANWLFLSLDETVHWYNPISWFTGMRTWRMFNSIS